MFHALMVPCPKQVTCPSPCVERTTHRHEHQNVWFLGGPQCNSPPTYKRTPVLPLAFKDLTAQHSISKCIGSQPLNIIPVMSKPQYELLTSSDRAPMFCKGGLSCDQYMHIFITFYTRIFQNKF